MTNVELLDGILLSGKVCENFKREYNENKNFREWLDLLIPEVNTCFNQTQNTPWHIYNVMEHILHSVEEMNLLTKDMTDGERKLLAYVMFFHDTGKPAYHTVREVDGCKNDSFKGHNAGSERTAARVLKSLPFSEKDKDIILKLVYDHDIFLKITDKPAYDWQIGLTEEFLKGYIEQLNKLGDGKKLFDYLILVGLSDNRAQNPAMTRSSLKLIEKIKAMADKL